MPAISAWAASSVTPGRSRPITRSRDPAPRWTGGVASAGSQTCAASGNPNFSGMTPTMVVGVPLTRIVVPLIARFAAKRVCQSR